MSKRKQEPNERKLGREFYACGAETVARELLGAILVHRVDGKELRAKIVETEAYVGPHDLACHASKGRTKRTEVMFGEAGHAYVYFCYGMHNMLNVVTGAKGDPQAVLIRAAEPIGFPANLSGPGNLTKGMKIALAQNGIDLTAEELFIERGAGKIKIEITKRIGVDYAAEWTHALLRFADAHSPAVSGQKRKRLASNRG